MDLLTVPLGIVVGLALGALGGGGSVLAVPSLVYVLGQTPQEATTASLLIVLASSLAALGSHARAGRVRVRAGLGFALAGLLTSAVTGALSRGLPGPVVLVGFAVVMLAAAVVMWRSGAHRGRPPTGSSSARPSRPAPSGSWKPLAAGAGVGVLIGVFGVGGGFLAVPALVAVLGLTMADAIGTSLLVIALNAVAALLTRYPGSEVDWAVVVPFAVAASVAAIAGGRLSRQVKGRTLQRAFAVVLVLLATSVLLDQLVG